MDLPRPKIFRRRKKKKEKSSQFRKMLQNVFILFTCYFAKCRTAKTLKRETRDVVQSSQDITEGTMLSLLNIRLRTSGESIVEWAAMLHISQ